MDWISNVLVESSTGCVLDVAGYSAAFEVVGEVFVVCVVDVAGVAIFDMIV